MKRLYQTKTLYFLLIILLTILGVGKNVHAQTDDMTPAEKNAAEGTRDTEMPNPYLEVTSGTGNSSAEEPNPEDYCFTTTGGWEVCDPEGVPDYTTEDGDASAAGDFLRVIYNFLLPAAVILGFFMVAKGGFVLLTSQGDPGKVQAGKEDLTSAIIGLIFVIFSAGILRVLISTLLTG